VLRLQGLYRTREVLDEMVAGLRAVGIDVYQIDHEDGNGQFEINFTYADCLKSADNFTFVKMAASEIAHKHGMIATFMPKPFPTGPEAARIPRSVGRRRKKTPSTTRTTSRAWPVDHGVSVPGRRIAACARIRAVRRRP